jgi:hypothetical protein
MSQITEADIEAARSDKGGFTRATLAEWGVPWPPPSGWKKEIIANGIPYSDEIKAYAPDAPITEDGLQRMMDNAGEKLIDGEPFDCEGELDIDPAKLLRKVVSAVISHGQAEILWEFPEVLAFFGSRIPQRHEVTHLHNVDERMFDVADKWPNRKQPEASQ